MSTKIFKHENVIVATVIVLCGIIYLLTLNGMPGVGGDNAHYVVLAKSMVSGQGFRNINFPDCPPEKKYGFGYPLLIAPVVFLFPDNFIALKLITVFFAVLSLFAVSILFKKHAGLPVMAVVLSLTGVNYFVVSLTHHVMTEIPYLFFSLIAIYFVERYGEDKSNAGRYFLPGVLSLCMSYFIRTIGIFLFAAAVIYLLIKKKAVKAAIIFLCFLAVTGTWILSSSSGSEGQSYISEFLLKNPYDPGQGNITLTDIRERIITSMRCHLHNVSYLSGYNLNKIWVIILPVVLAGFVISCRRSFSLCHIYVPLYFAVCSLWYWREFRFIVPVVPFVFYYFFTGIIWLTGRRQKIKLAVVSLCFLLIFSKNILFDITLIRNEQKADYYPPEWKNYFLIADWVRENAPEDSVVMCRKPYLFYLRSRRKTTEYPFTRDTGKVMGTIKKKGVDYVVLDSLVVAVRGGTTRRYLYPAVLQDIDMFEPVACTEEGPKTILLRVKAGEFRDEENRTLD